MSLKTPGHGVDHFHRFADLFPLPLRPFEELFVRDDTANYPAVFSVRFVFDGVLDRDVAETALQQVVARQPLLNVRLHESESAALEWRLAADQSANDFRVQSTDVGRLDPIDLRTSPPLRLSLTARTCDDGRIQSVVIVQFHHAIVDGVGALAVINDWMKSYGRLSLNEASSLAKKGQGDRLNAERLRDRCRAGLGWRERVRLARWSWLSLIGFWNFFMNRPVPLLPTEQIGRLSSATVSDPIVSAVVDERSTAAFKSRAGELAVTVNDLLAVELLAGIKAWQSDQGAKPTGSHLRITLPINERGMQHRQMPACNHCTMISLDRRPDQVPIDSEGESFRNFVQQVHHEIDTVRQWRLSLSFWSSLSWFRRLGGLKRWFATAHCRSTCVLTNLGQLSQRLRLPVNEQKQILVGGVPLSHVELAAPVRFGTVAAFSVFVYQRQLNITMNYDRRSLSRDDAEGLLDHFRQRLVKR